MLGIKRSHRSGRRLAGGLGWVETRCTRHRLLPWPQRFLSYVRRWVWSRRARPREGSMRSGRGSCGPFMKAPTFGVQLPPPRWDCIARILRTLWCSAHCWMQFTMKDMRRWFGLRRSWRSIRLWGKRFLSLCKASFVSTSLKGSTGTLCVPASAGAKAPVCSQGPAVAASFCSWAMRFRRLRRRSLDCGPRARSAACL